MEVRCLELLEGARSATGTAVIIDVFRAFTTAAFCVGAGAREIVLVGTPEEAFALRERDPTVFLTGEVGGEPIAGFDAGNSPSQVVDLDLRGRRVVQRSSSGTQGVVAAVGSDEIVLGSFVIAAATCRYVRSRARVTCVVAMGDRGTVANAEDIACMRYLESVLLDRPLDPASLIAALDVDHDRWPWWFPKRDAELALEVDRFDFALPVTREDGLLVARPVRV